MRLVLALVVLGLCAGAAFAAPGHVDEKPFSYPDGMFQNRDTFPEQEPNDTCPGQDVSIGDVVDPGELVEADRDWYHFVLTEPCEVQIGTDESAGLPTVDTYLELYGADCVTQLAVDDDGGPGLYSLITIDLAAGEYNVMVRGYSDFSTGFYRMFLNCYVPPPPEVCDTCEAAEENGCVIERCTTGTLAGDTSDDINDYSPTNSCTGYSQAEGLDEVIVMDLVEGDICDFIYTESGYDAAFYILTNCGDMNSCVVGADDPEEILGWVVPATGRYYLIIDGYSSFDTGGPYTLDYSIECPTPQMGACCFEDGSCIETLEAECDGYEWLADTLCDPNPCDPIPTDTNTWGQIKTSYR